MGFCSRKGLQAKLNKSCVVPICITQHEQSMYLLKRVFHDN